MAKQPVAQVRTIPEDNSVVRFCSGETGVDASGRVTGAAFLPREIDHGRVSVEWAECASGPAAAIDLEAVRQRLSARVAGYSNDGRLALLNVGAVRQIVIDDQYLDAVHQPTRRSDCHSTIGPLTGLLALPFAELLADLANENTEPA
jgi:hypothetical protein